MEIKPFLSLQGSLRETSATFHQGENDNQRRYLTILLKDNKRQCDAVVLLRVFQLRNSQGGS